MVKSETFVSVMKDLYYEQCRRITQMGDVSGSTRFVQCMRAVCDLSSEFIRESHPHYGPYSKSQQISLEIRAVMFGDHLAMWMWRENANRFFDMSRTSAPLEAS